MNVYALRMSLAEKALSLEDRLDYYLPKHFVLRRYATGMKRVLDPLLPSMVFARGRFSEVHRFQSIYSFIGFATLPKDGHRTPIVVPDPDMENFRIVADKCRDDLTYYSPREMKMHKGEYIRIIGGLFDGAVAKLVKVPGKRNRKLVVELPGIAEIATTSIEPQFVRKITKAEYDEALKRGSGVDNDNTPPARRTRCPDGKRSSVE